ARSTAIDIFLRGGSRPLALAEEFLARDRPLEVQRAWRRPGLREQPEEDSPASAARNARSVRKSALTKWHPDWREWTAEASRHSADRARLATGDRKSTRLNSSHVS